MLEGRLTFRCGGQTFEVPEGGLMFLPRGLARGYSVTGAGDARLLVVTAPAEEAAAAGWGGFVSDIEQRGERRTGPGR